MLNSVWLSNLIVTSLNESDSVLYSYYAHLRSITNSDESMMVLLEPEGSERTYFLISRSACITPIPGFKVNEEVLLNAIEEKKIVFEEGLLYCPLYYENISSFGAIVFKVDGDEVDREKLSKALVAFSSILYSESMGSIVKSYHDTMLRVENLSVDYTSGKITQRAVSDVSLEIYEKEFTIIAGASGSGKSSLLNVLGGMLTASEGHVWWKDKDITQMSEKQSTAYRGKTVGFIFQRYNLINDLTAEENINIAASLVDDPFTAAEVLDLVGLKDKAKSYPSQLSGGEQQRVCIARALVKKPKLLLCDEPTGALDTVNALQVITILQDIAKKQGIPVVVITHNPSLVVLADHLITISNGKVVGDCLQPFALTAKNM